MKKSLSLFLCFTLIVGVAGCKKEESSDSQTGDTAVTDATVGSDASLTVTPYVAPVREKPNTSNANALVEDWVAYLVTHPDSSSGFASFDAANFGDSLTTVENFYGTSSLKTKLTNEKYQLFLRGLSLYEFFNIQAWLPFCADITNSNDVQIATGFKYSSFVKFVEFVYGQEAADELVNKSVEEDSIVNVDGELFYVNFAKTPNQRYLSSTFDVEEISETEIVVIQRVRYINDDVNFNPVVDIVQGLPSHTEEFRWSMLRTPDGWRLSNFVNIRN